MDIAAVGAGILARRSALGWSQETVGRAANLSASYVSRLEKGAGKRPGMQVINAVAHALRIRDASDLEAIGRGEMDPLAPQGDVAERGPVQMPVFAWGAAGDPRSVDLMPDPVEYVDPDPAAKDVVDENAFAIQVKGTSMIGAGIPDGAVLYVNPGGRYRRGDVVLASIAGEGMVVRIFAGDELRSDGPGGPAPVKYKEAQIIGPVVWVAGHAPKVRRTA